MKNISILGSTGSIGVNALDVISKKQDRFRITTLAAGRNIDLLRRQVEQFRPHLAAVIDEVHAEKLRKLLGPGSKTEIVFGAEGYRLAVTDGEVDLVLSAMVGAAGLLPTLAAIEAGKDVALANKETMVIAGRIVTEKARAHGVRILPVDSEHSAVFQCLEGHPRRIVKRIILTASGGPFLQVPLQDMKHLKPEQALMHPNWTYGEENNRRFRLHD
jgi:1-deoxy-D-xylulose-5-phosphate reductoisomerase